MNYLLKIIVIGIGSTLIVDLWIWFLGLFNIKSLDYRFVGRWIGSFPKGKFFHSNIMNTEPVNGELILGWTSHYLIGITFSFLPFIFYGSEWLKNPGLHTGVLVGIITLAAPLFIMQPAFGFGIASSNLPEPHLRIIKSFMTHLVYGLGLYATALLVNKF
jgi:hypothetical protein